MTSHPADMCDDLIKVHGDVEFLMPYLHLPVQSGDDLLLKAMNRKYSVKDYLIIIEKLRSIRTDIAFSSDFIVGFPGETEQAFKNTIKLVEKVNYAQAYSFKYSRRPGTPGSIMKRQISEQIKIERLAELQDILNHQQLEYNRSYIGKSFEVLFERNGRKVNQLVGKSPYMQAVHLTEDKYKIGDLIDTKVLTADKNSLKVESIKSLSGVAN